MFKSNNYFQSILLCVDLDVCLLILKLQLKLQLNAKQMDTN